MPISNAICKSKNGRSNSSDVNLEAKKENITEKLNENEKATHLIPDHNSHKHEDQPVGLKSKRKGKKIEIYPLAENEQDYSRTSDQLRRSQRRKITPLAFWKNERVVYSRRRPNGIEFLF